MLAEYLRQQKIVAHCYSPDAKYVALSMRANHSIEIYDVTAEPLNVNKWRLQWTISDQSLTISSLDWSIDNKILSCSHDKSVYVYRLNATTNKWVKDLVLVANQRAVLCGSWSPNGQKFAVGTACNHVYVGYYEDKNNWWQTVKLSVNKSSVVAVKWHPSGKVLAVGSTDFSVQIVSALIPKNSAALSKVPLEDDSYSGLYDKYQDTKDGESEILFSIPNTLGWVEALDFSPNGQLLAIAVHNGMLQYFDIVSDLQVDFEGENRKIYPPTLPFTTLLFKDNETVIVGGYDRKPASLTIKGGWTWNGFLTSNISAAAKAVKSQIKQKTSAFEQKSGVSTQDDPNAHISAINCISLVPGSNGGQLLTNDTNGTINIWKL